MSVDSLLGEKQIPSLYSELQEVPDARDDQGQRHPLPAMLALACVALLSGYQTPNAISEWVDNYGKQYLERFGFTRDEPPSQATWYRVLGSIDWSALEDRLTRWGLEVLNVLEASTKLQGIAIDGKTLRGSKKQGAAESHLLSAVAHRLGVTLTQIAVADKSNEIGSMLDLLSRLVVEGHVFTSDALLTQRELAREILRRDGDFVFLVKRNQPQLYEDITFLFEPPLPLLRGDSWPTAETVDAAHGRIERRRLQSSTMLNDYVNWPGAEQVFRLQRQVTEKKTGEVTTQIVYGITSLTTEEADAEQLLRLVREHWHIENKSHWIRDVIFDEDRSQLRRGRLPHIMATLRNAVISLLHAYGITCVAKARRRFAARPDEAMALVGITA
jgi:predicted transposase YbfD/YdcC